MRHELHLARAGFLALAAISVVAVTAGGLYAGRAAAASAALGVAIVAANHAIAVASTAWARAISPRVIAVGYSVFVARMFFVLGTFGTLAQLPWVEQRVLAFSFCAALVASLVAECISYMKGSYVPAWMRRQAPLADGRAR